MGHLTVASLKTADAFREHLSRLGAYLPFEDLMQSGPDAPLAAPASLGNGISIGNRFAVLPMEGWDGTQEGNPSELTTRRWRNFGASGAKLIWGGEAVAVRQDGRANPHQLMMGEHTWEQIARLREGLEAAHRERFSDTSDLLVGLQLTHAGRFARPNPGGKPAPRIVYRHPVLDRRVGVDGDGPVLSDDEIARLTDDFVAAAVRAKRAGFRFVDIKSCHGYLGHEFLSAFSRPGRYGGDFENRTRFLTDTIAGVRAEAPGLEVGVRISAFDFLPYHPGAGHVGEPDAFDGERYAFAFGGDGSGAGIDLTETKALLDLLASLEVKMVCVSGGSPYYNPHIIRPAMYPPSDGYLPPEDPLVGVARQIAVTAELKRHSPDLLIIGSAYTYLQEWLPNVAQAVIRSGGADLVGLGRMMLSYPEFPSDVLDGNNLQKRLLCRTISDCTTAPRNGLVSGCYPLDRFYRKLPEAETLAALKKSKRSG